MALSRGWSTRRVILVASLVVASQVLPASLPAARRPALNCVQLKQWAQANASSLPRTLDAFAQLERGHRQAAFNVMSAADKTSLWREQMQRFLQRSDLTIAERRLATDVLTALTPEMYSASAEGRAASKVLGDRVTATFMSDDHRRAFIELGALGRPLEQQWTASPFMTAGVGSLFDRLAATATVEAQICECNVFDWTNSQCSIYYGNWCSWSWYYFCGVWYGCGPFWFEECNSMCDWI